MSQGLGHAEEVSRTAVRWPVVSVLSLLCLAGCFSIYLYISSGGEAEAALGLGTLVVGLFASLILSMWSEDTSTSLAASGITLVYSVALLTLLLPTVGNDFADTFILFSATTGAVLLYPRAVEVPSFGRPLLRESSIAVVFLLPIALAFAEAMFLGLRFWENFALGRPAMALVPLMALWGYVEEGLFRGAVQRSLLPLMGTRGAILSAAALNAAFMLFWGSLIYALFSFLLAILMGYIYHRTRSIMYVGTIHALQSTWLILAYLALGIVGH